MNLKKLFICQWLITCSVLALMAGCSAHKSGSTDAGGMANLAEQLRSRGDDAGAADFYQRILQRSPDDLDAHVALAQILEAHGDNAGAAAQFREASRLDPDNGEYHRDLGRVYIRMNQGGDAKNEYEKALSIDSDDVKAMNGLGISLDYLGNHEGAQKIYKQALGEKSDDLSVMNNLAHSYVLVGSYDQAINLLEPHIKDKAATPALRQNLAEAYGMAGMDADAERIGRMDLTPDQVRQNLAYYHAQRDRLSIAPKLYADLGNFPTEAVAENNVQQLRTALPKETAGLIVKTDASVSAIGGTPSFNVKVTGFMNAAKVKAFCDKAKKENIACKAHTN